MAQNCDIRFDLNPDASSVYDGRTIMHCHILEHEDQGAMGWADVVGGLGPPAYPNDGNLAEPYSEYYALDTGDPPPDPTDPTAVEVGSLTVSVVNIGQGEKIGRAEVLVVDDLGNPVDGATVSGNFTGTITEAATGVSDAGGLAVLDTNGSAKGKVSVTFCVTAITHPSLTDFSGEVCASS